MAKHRKNAFTLIELLVVIAVIGLLLSILLPALAKAKNYARTVICQSRLRQWGMIFEMYANDHDGIQSRVPIIAELSPKDMIPKYCHHYFPDEDKIIDFINPWHDENMYEAIAKYATWYPLDKLQRM